jgi:5'-3' exoribonuclease 2
MTEEDSEIIDFYPETFPIDLNGKKFSWQGVALLPFIEEKRLLSVVRKQYPKLTEEEEARNAVGNAILYVSDAHSLYNDISLSLYSKKRVEYQVKINPKSSNGLAGKVSRDELCIPHSMLRYPLSEGDMPDIEDNRTIT